MLSLKVRKIGNHWYPCIEHDLSLNIGFDKKTEYYFNMIGKKFLIDELIIHFDEVIGTLIDDNMILFNEKDILRYFTTDDFFDLEFKIGRHSFTINSDLYWLLETQFNFNFHKNDYRVYVSQV